jgi:hypothetical protein
VRAIAMTRSTLNSNGNPLCGRSFTDCGVAASLP